jgi:hypothetical protein
MGSRMELVAGEASDVLVVIGTDDREALRDGGRFSAYLSLSGGMDPTWLDLFAEAARAATELDAPLDFIDARIEIGGTVPTKGDAGPGAELTIERVDPSWISAVAAIPDITLDGVAGRWIDRLEEELGALPREEKPWIRELAGNLVQFCRTADRAPDVLFLWSL